jgi:hypothetical protein
MFEGKHNLGKLYIDYHNHNFFGLYMNFKCKTSIVTCQFFNYPCCHKLQWELYWKISLKKKKTHGTFQWWHSIYHAYNVKSVDLENMLYDVKKKSSSNEEWVKCIKTFPIQEIMT